MYTITVGKTFLKEYNKRHGESYSSKDFFDEVLFKYFFDAKKYLMWAQNSPFVQGINKKKPFFSPSERSDNLKEFHKKIDDGARDASIAIGFPASEIKDYATTSGAITDLKIPLDTDDIYYSWIGANLALGVAGGYSILINDPQITYATFEGWKVYRKYLDNPSLEKLRGNQILTWNGQWLTFRFGKSFSNDFNFNSLTQEKIFEIKDDKIEVNTVPWSRLFFSLSHTFKDDVKLAYVFSLGQTNKTIGFIPFQLKSGRRLHQIYNQLFGDDQLRINTKAFESLLGKHIKRACELGSIGLKALQPKNIEKYFAKEANIKLARPKLSKKGNETNDEFNDRKTHSLKKDESNIITFQTYKTWLIAMITKNKNEISNYSIDIAKALVKYREGARKTDRKNLLEKKLFASKRKTAFLEALIDIVNDSSVDAEIVEKVKSLRDKIHFMSNEDFIYFILLLKFDYAYQERISNN